MTARRLSATPPRSAYTRDELCLIDGLRTARQVQRYLYSLPYNRERNGGTLRSFRGVVRHGEAHCLEAVFLAAAVLEHHGWSPTVLDIESADRLDHVLLLYRGADGWGTIARSRDFGLEGRKPVFRSIRSLVNSYMDPFVDGTGRVVGFGTAHLDQLVRADWRLSSRNVWAVERALIVMPHRKVRMPQARYERVLRRYGALKQRVAEPSARDWRGLYGEQTARWE